MAETIICQRYHVETTITFALGCCGSVLKMKGYKTIPATKLLTNFINLTETYFYLLTLTYSLSRRLMIIVVRDPRISGGVFCQENFRIIF